MGKTHSSGVQMIAQETGRGGSKEGTMDGRKKENRWPPEGSGESFFGIWFKFDYEPASD